MTPRDALTDPRPPADDLIGNGCLDCGHPADQHVNGRCNRLVPGEAGYIYESCNCEGWR